MPTYNHELVDVFDGTADDDVNSTVDCREDGNTTSAPLIAPLVIV